MDEKIIISDEIREILTKYYADIAEFTPNNIFITSYGERERYITIEENVEVIELNDNIYFVKLKEETLKTLTDFDLDCSV